MHQIEENELDRDLIAAILSIIPGAGHLYKRHIVSGFGILLGGNLLMAFITALLAMATFGVALIVIPALYWVGVAVSAHEMPDWHDGHHHHVSHR